MFDGIGFADLVNAGGWGVLALLLALGWLVPKRTVDREQKLLIREADGWKAAHDIEAAQLAAILEELRHGAVVNGRRTRPAAAPDRGTG